MAQIQIRRGLQTNVTALTLLEGELAVALDTGNVYVGATGGKKHLNPLGTARTFGITGDGTAPAVSFDGSQNVSLALSLATMPGLTAGTYTKLTVDNKGRVTNATQLTVNDIPSLPNTKITGLGSASTLDTGTTAGKVVVVGADGKLPDGLMPAISVCDTFEAANQAAMLALTAQKGDICIRSDEGKSYILSASPATDAANWKWLRTPDCKVLSVNGRTGAVTLTAADVGAEPVLSGAAVKAAPIDADSAIISDSAASGATKKVTFTAIKSMFKAYFDTLYNKYVHPAYIAKPAGLYKVTVDGTGHMSAATAATKADITALGIPAQDTTYGVVTPTVDGLMIAADKAKLNGIAAGANNYALPTASASVLGGVKVGDGLLISSGVVSVGNIDGGTF